MQRLELLACSLDFIERHMNETVRAEDIAAACYCSKSTLEKLFHYVYHTSVHRYITCRKMMAAARLLAEAPDASILSVALEYGYGSHEAFTRAFKDVWNCTPSAFRSREKFTEIYPRFVNPLQDPLQDPSQKGDICFMQKRDISQLYELIQKRKNCYFVCCDIESLMVINQMSRKAGDLAILETIRRMDEAAGEEDIVFRIGGDEFCLLTNSPQEEYAGNLAEAIRSHNTETFLFEGRQFPLSLHITVTRFEGNSLRYGDLFSSLYTALQHTKA